MIGWSVLLAVLMSFFLFLFWRGRKRIQAVLAELSSRVALVEELLLEIYSVIEKKELFPELISPAETAGSLTEEEEDGSPVSLPLIETNPADGERMMTGREKREPEKEIMEKTQEQKVIIELENGELNKKAHSETAQPKTTTPPLGREIKKERLDKIDTSALPERSKTIIELLQKGFSVKEIARTSGIGQGEVQLIIDLYLQ